MLRESEWELNIPIGEIDMKVEVKWKKEEGDDDELPGVDIYEEFPEDRDKQMKNQHKEDEVKNKTIYVSYKHTVSKEDLQTHFQQFGDMEDISFTTSDENIAMVRFTSPLIAQSLIGKEQMLHGSIPLRLRGGSGRRGRVPPIQQRISVCPFR